MSHQKRLIGSDRANALAVVRVLEDLLRDTHPRLRMHAHAIKQALERSDRLDDRWLSKNYEEAAT
jgi:hypothetical protein